ncbi:MAG: GNAT family N-acetyltransferase [Proteobacteria bacterium]|nr:GNAT family N-acetyltransferase [Pseudomonadota bacterium]
MNITFTPLTTSHFPLLLKWLETPHVKAWWDQDISYTLAKVEEKYGSYTKEYKRVNGVDKPIQAYLICADATPIGYAQSYNVYDFPRDEELAGLPESLGGLDIFIGEAEYVGRGIGATAIKLFTKQHVLSQYKYAFVDPDYDNEVAVRAYEKAGFVIIKRVGKVFWMVAHKRVVRLPMQDCIALEIAFRRSFLANDRLWLFGSRVDLTRRGGDIDLYIETNADTIDEAVDMKFKFVTKLEEAIGEQKIDVVLNMLHFPYPLPIHDIAKTQGVRII